MSLKGKVPRTEHPRHMGETSDSGTIEEDIIASHRSEEPPPTSEDGVSVLKEVKIEPLDLHEEMYASTSNGFMRIKRDLELGLLGVGPFKNSPYYVGGRYYMG